jgi:hypothetical protein
MRGSVRHARRLAFRARRPSMLTALYRQSRRLLLISTEKCWYVSTHGLREPLPDVRHGSVPSGLASPLRCAIASGQVPGSVGRSRHTIAAS